PLSFPTRRSSDLSAERSGCEPPAGSTIASRSWTRIAPASWWTPLQSGPRWRCNCDSSSACRRSAWTSSPGCSPNMPKIEHIDHALLVGPAIPGAHEKGPHLAMRACIGGVVGSTTPGCSPLRARDCSPRGCGCGRSRCGRTAGPWRDGTAARPGLATVADTTVTSAAEYSPGAGRRHGDPSGGTTLSETMQRLSRTSQVVAMLARYRRAGILTGFDLGEAEEDPVDGETD